MIQFDVDVVFSLDPCMDGRFLWDVHRGISHGGWALGARVPSVAPIFRPAVRHSYVNSFVISFIFFSLTSAHSQFPKRVSSWLPFTPQSKRSPTRLR